MKESNKSNTSDDILIIPSNKNYTNAPSSVTSQIRQILYNVDNNNEDQNIGQYLDEIDRLKRQAAHYKTQYIVHYNRYNKAVQSLQSKSNEEDRNSLQNKYKKALVELSTLLNINKQLKAEVDQLRYRSNERGKTNYEEYEILIRQKEQIQFINNRLENRIKELQSTNSLYASKLKEYENSIKAERQHFENQLINLTNNCKNKELELKQLRYKSENKIHFNENEGEYKNLIERYKSQESELINEIRKLHQHILDQENHLNESKLEYEKESERKNNEFHEITLKMRRESQEQIFAFKSENNNLKEINTQLEREKEKLLKEQAVLREKSADKQKEQAKFELELKSQIENLKLEIDRLKNISESKEELTNEITQLNKQLKQMSVLNSELQSKVKDLETKIVKLETRSQKLSVESVQQSSIKDQKQEDLQDKSVVVRNLLAENDLLKKKIIMNEVSPDRRTVHSKSKKELETINTTRELQHQVVEFRNRMEVFLNMKENMSNTSPRQRVQQSITVKLLVNQLQSQVEAINQKYEENKNQTKIYKERIAIYQKKIENLTIENKTLHSKIKGYDQLVTKLEHQLQKQITSGRGNQSQNQSKLYIEDLTDRLQLQDKYFKQELQTRTLEYQSKILKQTETHQSTIQLLNSKIDSLERIIQQNKAVEDRYADASISKDQVEKLITKLKQSQEEISNLKYREGQLRKYDKQVDELRQQIAKKQEVIRLAQLNLSFKDNSSKISELERQNYQNRQEINLLLRKNQQLNSTILRFKTHSQQSQYNQSQQVLQLRNNLQIKETELDRLRVYIQTHENEFIQISQKLHATQKQNQRLVDVLEKNNTIYEQNDQQREKIIKTYDSRINDMFNIIEEIKAENERYSDRQHALSKQRANNQQLLQDIQHLNHKIERCQRQLQQQKQQNIDLTNEIYRLRKHELTIYDLERELNSKHREISDLRYSNSNLEAELERTKQECRNEKYDKQKSKQHAQQLQTQNQKLQYQLYDLKVRIQSYQQSRMGNEALSAEIDRLKKIVNQQESDLSEIKLRYSQSSAKQLRIQQNLAMFVLIFAEVEALRNQLKQKDAEIKELNNIKLKGSQPQMTNSRSFYHKIFDINQNVNHLDTETRNYYFTQQPSASRQIYSTQQYDYFSKYS